MKPRTVEILRNLGPSLIGFGLVTIGFGLAWQEEPRILIGGIIAAVGVRLWFTKRPDQGARDV